MFIPEFTEKLLIINCSLLIAEPTIMSIIIIFYTVFIETLSQTPLTLLTQKGTLFLLTTHYPIFD